MLNSDDIARMKATNTAIIADKSTSIAILRGDSTESAQTVRLVDLSQRPMERLTEGGDVVLITLVVVGEHDMNIQRGDRFFVNSAFYEVIVVRPWEHIKTVAECQLVT